MVLQPRRDLDRTRSVSCGRASTGRSLRLALDDEASTSPTSPIGGAASGDPSVPTGFRRGGARSSTRPACSEQAPPGARLDDPRRRRRHQDTVTQLSPRCAGLAKRFPRCRRSCSSTTTPWSASPSSTGRCARSATACQRARQRRGRPPRGARRTELDAPARRRRHARPRRAQDVEPGEEKEPGASARRVEGPGDLDRRPEARHGHKSVSVRKDASRPTSPRAGHRHRHPAKITPPNAPTGRPVSSSWSTSPTASRSSPTPPMVGCDAHLIARPAPSPVHQADPLAPRRCWRSAPRRLHRRPRRTHRHCPAGPWARSRRVVSPSSRRTAGPAAAHQLHQAKRVVLVGRMTPSSSRHEPRGGTPR